MTNESQSTQTMNRIFASAEKLFVEHGFESTSLRNITTDANVNLAAINYHFGGKEALIKAVFVRRFAPYLHECTREVETLQTLNSRYGVEDVVRVLLKPALSLANQPDKQGLIFVRLISRMLVDNHRLVRDTMTSESESLIGSLLAALKPLLPDYSDQTLQWRIHFMFSLIFHAFAGNDIFKLMLPGEAGSARDPELIARQLMPFLTGAVSAPNPV
ncbi:TetR family transcriptional regulator [Suttonella sp. R2A3]|uniref:TetR/AcrR family transcriptional regulator n=1 Tax=Suttonella sp. R2A3 TaxID=2908648 RepID=UPI001F30C2EF|nr:TetR/AcrR family transcriptional regulator [Suttonella sp. R2A3]UJF24333.1 TetR family transcriptional regulator [Suttonella sp. R2A3]